MAVMSVVLQKSYINSTHCVSVSRGVTFVVWVSKFQTFRSLWGRANFPNSQTLHSQHYWFFSTWNSLFKSTLFLVRYCTQQHILRQQLVVYSYVVVSSTVPHVWQQYLLKMIRAREIIRVTSTIIRWKKYKSVRYFTHGSCHTLGILKATSNLTNAEWKNKLVSCVNQWLRDTRTRYRVYGKVRYFNKDHICHLRVQSTCFFYA